MHQIDAYKYIWSLISLVILQNFALCPFLEFISYHNDFYDWLGHVTGVCKEPVAAFKR